MAGRCFLFGVFFAIFRLAFALDLNWIPADEDGPLPVSSSYRDELRKLCALLNDKKALPPEIIGKKEIIERMCTKLRSASGSGMSSNTNVGYAVAVLLGVATLYLLWGYSKHLIFISTRDPAIPSTESLREKRMKKFI